MWLVFDIETVPDAAAGRRWLGLGAETADHDVRLAMMEARRAQTGSAAFLKPAFHQIVAIAGALIDEQGSLRRLRALGEPSANEPYLVAEFFRIVQESRPRLVGWNSSGFDLPALVYRAVRHNVVTPAFYRAGEPYHSYRKRYDEELHIDLMDLLSAYGALATLSLHEMASVLGVPGKMDVSGEDVLTLYAEGAIDRIREYCMRDVMTTTVIFGQFAHHRGWLADDAWTTFQASIQQFLTEHADSHWTEYARQWQSWAD